MSIYKTFVFVSFIAAAATCHGEETKRHPIPNKTAAAESKQLVKETFGGLISKATKSAQKVELAATLTEKSKDSSPSNMYTMLTLAIKLASDGGGVKEAFDAIDAITTNYETDGKDLTITALKRLTTKASSSNQLVLVQKCMERIPRAMDADEYTYAMQLAQHANMGATKAKDKSLAKKTYAVRRDLIKVLVRFKKVKLGLKTLKETPNDAEANLIVGEFYCFVKGDWPKGLSMLTKCGKEPQQSLAVIELDKPTKPDDQNELAEAWWEIADKAPEIEQHSLRSHAAYWYKQALPGLSGLLKAVAKKRAEEFQETVATKVEDTAVATASPGFDKWVPTKGKWSIKDGILTQSSMDTDCRIFVPDSEEWTDYIFEVQARKTGGKEGFLIIFRAKNKKQLYWWNLGGWSNSKHVIETRPRSIIAEKKAKLVNNKWYKIKIKVEGPSIECYLNGVRVHKVKNNIYPVGGVGLGTWLTTVDYRKPRITTLKGKPLH